MSQVDAGSIARRAVAVLAHPLAMLLALSSFVLAGATDYVFCYVMVRRARADTPDEVRTVLEACSTVITARQAAGRRGAPTGCRPSP